ncbi:Arginine permease-like protein [Hapsidospora chrysogenum ATCC 11550]|uniref:Arginine permease-like protein n=1 Tax=Hapsidospora chrysogenum (strain ATCC 11550 / CBS 779.69 / DSM 880 / IAM 14645 / JCM 23072 / IMI 49137) TaxID=857340 RepID=A0A086T8A3_HAPC1|nr:Arginine permease-like protein [Hapsidospora chrysogenum ATCC 11550]
METPSEKTPRVSAEKMRRSPDEQDVEAGSSKTGLDRTLQSRHLQFIAIGGTIGTGLFLGTGGALSKAGPVSLLIAFIFIGSVVYSVMSALGEMAAYIPVTGAFTAYASRFVDPTLGFAMGWTYWFSWSLTFALELTAAGLIIHFWDENLSVGIWIAVFWAVFTALNYLPVKWFGEVEMWLSSIKVVTIVGFIIFSICVNAGVGDQGYIGFKYWENPGAFAEYLVSGATGKFVGFWAVLITAGFSFQGSELVGIAAGETEDPRKSIPSAIRWTFWGIFSLFVATVFFLGINIPYTNDDLLSESQDASASPLVIVAKLAGVPVLPHIINAVLLSAVLTAANSNVYSSSRILVALADSGHAPKFLKRTNRIGTPIYSVGICSLVGFLAFLNLSEGGTVVFDWLLNIVAVAGFISWALINLCHLRFMRALAHRGIKRSALPYAAPLQPYLSYFGLFFNVLIVLTSGFTVFMEWSTSDFFASYVSVILFVVMFVGHKLVCRTKIVPLAEVDLVHGCIDS